MTQPAQIVVTRTDQCWQVQVSDLHLTQEVRTLFQLDRWVRDRFGPGWINYRFRTGDADLDRLVTQAREAREATRRTDERTHQLTRQVLVAADRARLSGRDLAVLLGMSHQRIHQLQRERAE
jgi:hypothetical protein